GSPDRLLRSGWKRALLSRYVGNVCADAQVAHRQSTSFAKGSRFFPANRFDRTASRFLSQAYCFGIVDSFPAVPVTPDCRSNAARSSGGSNSPDAAKRGSRFEQIRRGPRRANV